MASTPADTRPAAAFDASEWLADWAENGGVVLLVHDRLYLRRLSPLDRAASIKLDRLRDLILNAEGGPAVADVLGRRREGLLS